MQGYRTIVVSRHTGAIEWLRRHGFRSAEVLAHLTDEDIAGLVPGDMVIGVLPVGLAARVCAAGATFLALELDVPVELRSVELTAEDMDACNVRVQEYLIEAVD